MVSRRLREALPVAPRSGRARKQDDLRRDVGRIARALGPVRELDVALDEFQDAGRCAAFGPVAVSALVAYLGDLRVDRMQEMERKLAQINLKRLSAALDDRADGCASSRPSAWQNQLATRLRQRARRFAAELRAAGTLYASEPIHDVRVAGKKLRYTLELAGASAGVNVRTEVTRLKRLQEALGRLHDLQVLQHFAREAAAATPHPAIGAGLESMQRVLEAECRQLHARFLSNAGPLMDVADRSRIELPALVALGAVARGLKAGPAMLRVVRRARTA